MGVVLYLVAKFLAYSAWCYLGLRWIRRDHNPLLLTGVAFGFLRLFMGFFFAVLIFLFSSSLMSALGSGLAQNVAAYLAIYVPVRWIEWTLMTIFMFRSPSTLLGRGFGTSLNDRLWRMGGIAISCLADIPLIASLGGVIPVGRFLC
jgi:hypothetical protein